MANLASVLKEEIGRLARKEIRQQTAGTVKSTAQLERDIAALQRQVEDLQRKLSSQQTQDGPRQTATTKATSKKKAVKPKGKTAAGTPSAPAKSAKKPARTGFSSKALKAERERLGISADNYGRLVGVSGLSIYNWEQGKASPRESSIAALMSVRGIGKREAAKRLSALGEPKTKEKQAGKAKQGTNAAKAKGGS